MSSPNERRAVLVPQDGPRFSHDAVAAFMRAFDEHNKKHGFYESFYHAWPTLLAARPAWCRELEEAQAECALMLGEVVKYNEGTPPYQFSGLSDEDRSNVTFDVWQELRTKIDRALARLAAARGRE